MPDIDSQMQDADRLARDGNWRDAEKLLLALTASNPQQSRIWQALGTLYARGDNFEKAEDAYRRVIEIDPNHHLANYNLGYLLWKRSKIVDAIFYLKRAQQLKPEHQKTQTILRKLEQRLSETKQAEGDLPDSPDRFVIEGVPLLRNFAGGALLWLALLSLSTLFAMDGFGMQYVLFLWYTVFFWIYREIQRRHIFIRITESQFYFSRGILKKTKFTISRNEVVQFSFAQSKIQRWVKACQIVLHLEDGRKSVIPSIASLDVMTTLYNSLLANSPAASAMPMREKTQDPYIRNPVIQPGSSGKRAEAAKGKGRDTELSLPETEEEFMSYEARIKRKAQIDAQAKLEAEALTPGVLGRLRTLYQIMVWIIFLGVLMFVATIFFGIFK